MSLKGLRVLGVCRHPGRHQCAFSVSPEYFSLNRLSLERERWVTLKNDKLVRRSTSQMSFTELVLKVLSDSFVFDFIVL